MNDFNLLRELFIIYGSATISSLLFNEIYFVNKTKKAFYQSKRKLKYRDLSTKCLIALDRQEISFKDSIKASRILSSIPIFQILFTCKNILDTQKVYNDRFDEDIDIINKEELEQRKEFLVLIKALDKIPKEIKEKMNNQEYLPSEEDYRNVLDYNRPKIIINTKTLKIIKHDENDKDISEN